MAEKSFKQLINESKEILWAPCVYDCVSTKCAEMIGFKAVTISSYEQMHAFTGRPFMTQDEMFRSAESIIRCTPMAVLVDGEDGGGDPQEVYYNVKRYAEIGAMAISIEDQFHDSGVGVHAIGADVPRKSYSIRERTMPAELWAANIQAAVEATKGTDCMVIARVDSKETLGGKGPEKFPGRPGLSIDECIRRARLGVEMGAPMTMIQMICYRGGNEEWEKICKEVPGWHCYPDIHADRGLSDVDDVNELYKLGFQMVTCHCFQKGAMKGMLEYGRHVFKDKNTIFTENDDFGMPIYMTDPNTFEREAVQCNRWIDTIEKAKSFK